MTTHDVKIMQDDLAGRVMRFTETEQQVTAEVLGDTFVLKLIPAPPHVFTDEGDTIYPGVGDWAAYECLRRDDQLIDLQFLALGRSAHDAFLNSVNLMW
jgi:hypothetical protein